MTKRELLENYRYIVIEIRALDQQSEFLDKYAGGPRPMRSVQLTGMPRGTNNPEAAMMQRSDIDEVLAKIEVKRQELRDMVSAFEHIVSGIDDRRLRIIIRQYYALGYTDDRIGDELDPKLSRQHVNRLRLAYLEGLDG